MKIDARHLNYWEKQAKTLHWARVWNRVLEWQEPYAKWFEGGQLNVAYNCVDRHVEAGLGDRVAIYWEGEPGDRKAVSYRDLQQAVNRFANGLIKLGVKKGDRVAIYMPMVPEAVVAMLACARLGIIHTVVFGGFSAEALRARIEDVGATLVVTADGGYRRGQASAIKAVVDEAVEGLATIQKVVVVRRTGQPVNWEEARDIWWHDLLTEQSKEHVAVAHEAEDSLFVLYTSGTTARPKGILHTMGGYLTSAASTVRTVFDVNPTTDVYWCTADIGWITGHTYVVYGPLANGMTQVMYEGAPDFPTKSRWWEIIQRYGVSIFYTSPTAVRMFMKWGREVVEGHNLTSIRLLGSVGEPINPEAWRWYQEVIGAGKAPIVDTWWQTETGSIMMSPLPKTRDAKPGAVMGALSGVSVEVVDEAGKPVDQGGEGYLVVTEPWPSMLRGIWGDDARYRETYWSRFAGLYFAGDGARRDKDDDIWVLGRVDDVISVSGHRISTAEVESALVGHGSVAEAAAVGVHDALKGQVVVAFVIMQGEAVVNERVEAELRRHVAAEIGAFAKPQRIVVVDELPKTRSGKIMRRLLRDAVEHRAMGDVTTLTDGAVMGEIAARLGPAE